MKILFVATRKNRDPEERELYEMDLMNEVLGFKRSLYDLGILTVAACTPERFEVAVRDEYLAPIDYDEPADLVALSAKTSCVARAYEVAREFRARGRRVGCGRCLSTSTGATTGLGTPWRSRPSLGLAAANPDVAPNPKPP